MVVIFSTAVLRRAGMGVGGSMIPGFLPIVRSLLLVVHGFLLVVGGSGVVIRGLGVIVRDLFYTGFLWRDGRRRPCRAR